MSGTGRRERRLTGGKGSDRSPTWVLGEGPGLDVLHEHIDTDGDHDLRTVRVSDGTYTDILVRSDRDETPSSAALAWFAFARRTTSSSTIRTSDVDAPMTHDAHHRLGPRPLRPRRRPRRRLRSERP